MPLVLQAIESNLPIAHGTGLYRAIENQPAVFNINAPNNLDGNLNIEIKGSTSANNVRSYVKKQDKNNYEVTYFAMETGLFSIFIRWNDKEIMGSPFKTRVVNPAKIKLLDRIRHGPQHNLLFDAALNEEKKFTFDTKDAGPGKSFKNNKKCLTKLN